MREILTLTLKFLVRHGSKNGDLVPIEWIDYQESILLACFVRNIVK